MKGSTARLHEQTRRYLVDFFGADRLLTEITKADADNWAKWLRATLRLSEATAQRRAGFAKQFFRTAVREGYLRRNPFAHLASRRQTKRTRYHFVTRATVEKLLKACPDAQWRLIVALARYGGLRCPSEHLALTWGDVDLDEGTMAVTSPMTERHDGQAIRVVPIFPELRPYLEAAFEGDDSQHVITRYRNATANLRTELLRIIKRAKLKPWQKPFENLRASCRVELKKQFPSHMVAEWLGCPQEF